MAVDAVIVTQQVSGLPTEGCGFSKLLNDPFHGGMVRRCEMNHAPSTMAEDNKHIEKRKVECDHGKEVHCQETSRWLRRKGSQFEGLSG